MSKESSTKVHFRKSAYSELSNKIMRGNKYNPVVTFFEGPHKKNLMSGKCNSHENRKYRDKMFAWVTS